MKQALLLVLGLYAVSALAAVKPSDLIKVTNEITQQCVEYYDYHGELYCSLKALQKQPVDPDVRKYETQKLVFDDRPWIAAWGKKTDDIVTVEYVPMGDDINDWKELVTTQYFAGLQNKTTPEDFANIFIDGMKQAGYDPLITFHKNTPEQVLFEFRITKPAEQVEDELQLVTKGSKGIYVLHYVIKKADMGDKLRNEWMQNLLKASQS